VSAADASEPSGVTDAGGVQRLNHAVLWVRDAETSADFYEVALGLERIATMPGVVFMKAPASGNYHDLGLFTTPNAAPVTPQSVGMYHIAWQVRTLGELAERRACLESIGALVGASDHGATKSLYAHDPDGIEFEILWEVPSDLIDPGAITEMTRPLDLPAEIERYGAETLAD
jgi:catechol-2,3-dioxygenase